MIMSTTSIISFIKSNTKDYFYENGRFLSYDFDLLNCTLGAFVFSEMDRYCSAYNIEEDTDEYKYIQKKLIQFVKKIYSNEDETAEGYKNLADEAGHKNRIAKECQYKRQTKEPPNVKKLLNIK